MREAGYSEEACLDLDFAFVGFTNRFRRERDATVARWEKPEKPPHRGWVRVHKPRNAKNTLLGWLGIDPEDLESRKQLDQIAEIVGIDAESWDALPDYPEDDPEETLEDG